MLIDGITVGVLSGDIEDEALTLDTVSQDIVPDTTSTRSLGDITHIWSDFFTGNATVSGDLTANQGITDTVYALAGVDLDPSNGAVQTKTIAADTTFTESLADGQAVTLMLTGADSFVITWPTMTWMTSAGNTAPTLTASDTVVLWQANSVVYGAYVGSGV